MSKPVFSGKNKKNIINLLSAELRQRVLKVKIPFKSSNKQQSKIFDSHEMSSHILTIQEMSSLIFSEQ